MESLNPDREAARIEEFIADAVQRAGSECGIVGLSGGVDSSVSVVLALRALDREKVIAVFMPDDETPGAESEDARELAEEFGLSWREISIEPVLNSFERVGDFSAGIVRANLKVRIRMCLLYALANEHNGLVIGTGNLSEWLLGYFTKYGDGAVDVAPIRHLYKTEIKHLARYLEIPETIVSKPPTAGLWGGQTDEGELGASYEVLDKILVGYVEQELNARQIAEHNDIDLALVKGIISRVDSSDHKRRPIPHLERI